MFGLGFPELVVILVVCLLLFGPGKIPELGAALGKSLRDFQRALNPPPEDAAASPPSPTAVTTRSVETNQDKVG